MNWTESTPLNPTNLNSLETRVSDAATSVTNGKTAVAAAITAMGQAAAGSDSFATLVTKIQDISDDANAAVSDVLATKTFYQGGSKKTGNIPSKVAATYTPSQTAQEIAAGQYLYGKQTIASLGGDAAQSDVRSDATFSSDTAGRAKAGTMPVNGSQTATLQITGAAKPTKSVPAGYTPGGTITAELAAALAAYIKSGTTIGGVAGTNTDKKWASGTVTSESGWAIEVTGLAFTPAVIIAYISGTEKFGMYDARISTSRSCTWNGTGFTWGDLSVYSGYVNSSGFRIPGASGSTQHTWLAIA